MRQLPQFQAAAGAGVYIPNRCRLFDVIAKLVVHLVSAIGSSVRVWQGKLSTFAWCLQTDVKYKLAMRAKKPEQRLRTFLGFCQPKKECPYTNAPQPMYRMDGMRIMMEFPKPKADDDLPAEQADCKQVQNTAML
jgi:hypothetical protein